MFNIRWFVGATMVKNVTIDGGSGANMTTLALTDLNNYQMLKDGVSYSFDKLNNVYLNIKIGTVISLLYV